MIKPPFFNQLILALAIFSFFTGANASENISSSREVYLADEPLPKIVARLDSLGRSSKEIVTYLKRTLPKITPELAQEKFGIKWIDNDLSKNNLKNQIEMISQELGAKKSPTWPVVYPAVAICYMDPEVGYGLFAIDNIKRGTIIAEYTGKHVKEQGLAPRNSYDAAAYIEGKMSYEKVVAEHEGNAARFAQHFLTKDDLSLYGYEFFDKGTLKNVVTPNSGLTMVVGDDYRHVILIATEDINRFEQIGYSYDLRYGYEHSEWPQEPRLFDKSGSIIPFDQYRVLRKGVIFLNANGTQAFFLSPGTEDELRESANSIPMTKDYVVFGTGGDKKIFIKRKVWEEQISRSRNRLSIRGVFISILDMVSATWMLENDPEKKEILQALLGGEYSDFNFDQFTEDEKVYK